MEMDMDFNVIGANNESDIN